MQKITQLEKIIGYSFNNKELLKSALSHCSCGVDNNERLEFLGDSLLNSIITIKLYALHTKAAEGQLTRMRAALVCKKHLYQIAMQLHLQDFVLLGKNERRQGVQQSTTVLADALEAIVAAIFLDSNYNWQLINELVLHWFAHSIENMDANKAPKDAKTKLQEWLQSQGLPTPEYSIENVQGPDHCADFTVACKARGKKSCHQIKAVEKSRRLAEQAAAEQMLVWVKEQW